MGGTSFHTGYELKSRKFVGWGDAGTPTAFRIRGGGACTCCMARFVVGVRRLTPTYSLKSEFKIAGNHRIYAC